MVWRVTNEPVDCRPSRGTNKHTQDRKRCSFTERQLNFYWTTTQQQLPITTVHTLTTPLITYVNYKITTTYT